MSNLQVHCPCCESVISVDSETGAVISFSEKKKHGATFEELQSELGKKNELRDQLFGQEQKAQKERARILDEKFKEAVRKADTKSNEPFLNPLDID